MRNGGDFCFLERIPENRRWCGQYTQKHCTCSALQSLHQRGTHIERAWLKNCTPLEKRLPSGPHMSHPLLLSHLLRAASTSSSSFTLFYHNTRTRSTIGTTRSTQRTPSTSSISPSIPGRQAAPSRATLA